MAAASERVGEYRLKADQFCKRILDFLSIMFKFQVSSTRLLMLRCSVISFSLLYLSLTQPATCCILQIDQLLNPKNSTVQNQLKSGQLPAHDSMEDFLGRYCGLMLFVKEIDSGRYSQICSVSLPAFRVSTCSARLEEAGWLILRSLHVLLIRPTLLR